MKAIVTTRYGSPELLQLRDIEKPTPKENEVLVKIHATTINDYDWSMVRGKPYIYRLLFGITKPKRPVPGMELAGTIEALGSNVNSFQTGDEVYGDLSVYGFGSFAEYVCINENALTLKPADMTFEEAASIPHASMLALQGLCDIGEIKNGQKILINGAGGGMGTFAFQLARMYESEITGVDTGEKLEMIRAMGFDHVIDYRKEDFTKNGQQYDLILDAKTNHSPFSYARSLKSGGTYVTVGGTPVRLIQSFLLGPLISRFNNKKIRILALKPNKDLDYINKLFTAGKIKCIIDGPYALSDIPKAIQYFGEGKHTGKVVISLLSSRKTFN